jgi:hypothetical protein
MKDDLREIMRRGTVIGSALRVQRPDVALKFPDGTPKPAPLPEVAGFAQLMDIGRPWAFTIRAQRDGVEFTAWDGDEMLGFKLPVAGELTRDVEFALTRVAHSALVRGLAMRHGDVPQLGPAAEMKPESSAPRPPPRDLVFPDAQHPEKPCSMCPPEIRELHDAAYVLLQALHRWEPLITVEERVADASANLSAAVAKLQPLLAAHLADEDHTGPDERKTTPRTRCAEQLDNRVLFEDGAKLQELVERCASAETPFAAWAVVPYEYVEPRWPEGLETWGHRVAFPNGSTLRFIPGPAFIPREAPHVVMVLRDVHTDLRHEVLVRAGLAEMIDLELT